jgi:hypothetical protein
MTLTKTEDREVVQCDGCGATEERAEASSGWRSSRDGDSHSCPTCAADDDTFLPAFADVDSMTVDELQEHFGTEHRNRIVGWLASALRRRQVRPVHDHPDRYELEDELQFPLGVSAGL